MLLNLFEKLKSDARYRIKFFLRISLVFNLLYFLFLSITSKILVSNWFLIMAIYYGLLFIIRFVVLRQIIKPKNQIYHIKTLRFCGYFLLLVNLVVSAFMFILIFSNKVINYHEIIVITLATYTFFSLTVAIIGSIKFIKKKDFVFTSVKLISLVSASVSMVTLTNTMLSTFGEDNALLRSIILPLLCVAVSIFIIATAIIMIKKANIALKSYKNEQIH